MKNSALRVVATLSAWLVVTGWNAAHGQELDDGGKPSPSAVRGSKYPWIHPDGRISFRIKAPEAKTVVVRSKGMLWNKQSFPMKKDEKGAWTVTAPSYDPGLYYYEFVVDGAGVADPGAQTFIGWAQATSMLEIPDPSLDFYDAKDVPHGEVRMRTWFSKTTAAFRRAYIYTPPDYDKGKTRYPVLYLQHGSGESEQGWTAQGRANLILDNLLAAKKAKPMIVVMENGYAVEANAPVADGPGPGRGNEGFEKMVVNDLVPMVDATYRTIAKRESRAIAGLSMGGGQAMRIGMNHQDVFSAFAGLSSGGGRGPGAPGSDPATLKLGGVDVDVAKLNKAMKLIWLGFGQQDDGYARGKPLHETLEKAGVKHIWFECPGGHEWQVWRNSLHDLAPRLFQ